MSQDAARNPLVLILEDEAIIALNLQDELQDSGYRVAGPFTSCADALTWLDAETPDVAVLDTMLKDGPCRTIALELSKRAVPFLIYSGHREERDLLPDFDHVTWIEKPVPPSVLIEECKQLLAVS
jgi:DNA-binding response OmpR family regulator